MPQRCRACDHPQIDEINKLLIAGASLQQIADDYGLKLTSLHRHRDRHLAPVIAASPTAQELMIREMAAAHELQEVDAADSLLAEVRNWQREATEIYRTAKDGGDTNTALKAINQSRKLIELIAKMLEILRPGDVQVNFIASPQWMGLREAMVRIANRFPETRGEILTALDGVREVKAIDYQPR